MPYVHKIGDIFTTELPAISHGVNLHGVMGSGIARLIAKKYPEVLPPYINECASGAFLPGSCVAIEMDDGMWIYNLSSQDAPGANARMEWLISSVNAGILTAKSLGHEGFAIPRIGAGIGGLEWVDVKAELERCGDSTDLTLEIWSLPDADD